MKRIQLVWWLPRLTYDEWEEEYRLHIPKPVFGWRSAGTSGIGRILKGDIRIGWLAVRLWRRDRPASK